MSAWVCSNEHISYLVSAAVAFNPRREADQGGPDSLGRLLLRENVRSVLFRYGADVLPAEEVEAYAKQIEAYRWTKVDVDPVVALSLLASWRYQTCETPDYPTTTAWSAARSIEELAIRALPGYGDAPWSI